MSEQDAARERMRRVRLTPEGRARDRARTKALSELARRHVDEFAELQRRYYAQALTEEMKKHLDGGHV